MIPVQMWVSLNQHQQAAASMLVALFVDFVSRGAIGAVVLANLITFETWTLTTYGGR